MRYPIPLAARLGAGACLLTIVSAGAALGQMPPQPNVRSAGRAPYASAPARSPLGVLRGLAAKASQDPPGTVHHAAALEHLMRTDGDSLGNINWKALMAARLAAFRSGGTVSLDATGGTGGTGVGGGGILDTPGWHWIGPANLSSPFFNFGDGTGDFNGRVNAAAFDPNNQSTYYIAAAGGGIWKTTNMGATWTALTDGLPGEAMSAITVDPRNSNVLFAGSGDYDGTELLGFGLWKSTDGGSTWAQLTGLPSGIHCIRTVVVDPNNDQHVLVGLGRDTGAGDIMGYTLGLGGPTPDGSIYQSMDGGATWTDVHDFQGYVSHIIYDKNSANLYASVDLSGIYKSTDNGTTWTGPLGGIGVPPAPPFTAADGSPTTGRLDVGTSFVNANTLYVLSETAQAVYTSADGGATWKSITSNISSVGNGWGQAWYDFYLGVTGAYYLPGIDGGPGIPTQDSLYVGLLDLLQSLNEGASWQTISYTYTGSDTTHTDQHYLIPSPINPNLALACNDGGVYELYYIPNKDLFRFTSLNAWLGITEIYSSAVNPVDPHDVLIGSQDNGSAQPYGDNLNLWNEVTGGDGGFCAINPTNPQNRYTTAEFGAGIQTDDDWSTSILSASNPDSTQFIWPLTISADTEFLVSAGAHISSFDHGATVVPAKAGKWTNQKQLDSEANVVASSPTYTNGNTPPGLVFAGTVGGGTVVSGGTVVGGVVWAAPDGGKTASAIGWTGNNPSGGLASASVPITAIAASANNPQELWVGVGGAGIGQPHLYHTTSAALPMTYPAHATWQAVDGSQSGDGHVLPDIPVNTIAVANLDSEQTIYVGTDFGVYYTTNGGQDWFALKVIPGTTGTLPPVPVTQLTYNASTGTLDAATFGRGLWRGTVTAPAPVQLLVRLPGFRGDKTRLPVTTELFHSAPVDAGQFLEDNGAVIYPLPGVAAPFKYFSQPAEFRTGSMSPAGYMTVSYTSAGTYDLFIRAPRFLRKRVRNMQLPSPVQVNPVLVLGDVNGDNSIDMGDYYAILNYINQEKTGQVSKYNNSTLDLNGDGVVDYRDLEIVEAAIIRGGGAIKGD